MKNPNAIKEDSFKKVADHLEAFKSLARLESVFLKALEKIVEQGKKGNYLIGGKIELQFFDNEKFIQKIDSLIQEQQKMRN